MENKIRCDVLENYGSLSGNVGDTELRLVKWNGKIKYDLRKWGDGNKPHKGITINQEELPVFIKLVDEALLSDKPKIPTRTIKISNSTIQVFNNYGVFGNSGQYKKVLAYIKWVREPKYDIRFWLEDLSKCANGVALTEKEMKGLSCIIHTMILRDNESNKGTIDTSEIDDLLL